MASLYRDLVDRLRKAGCRLVRQGKGSHEIWHSPLTNRTFVVPMNINSKPLVNAILKQAGLKQLS